jgi:dTDP-4-dehydrorhamnose reductase
MRILVTGANGFLGFYLVRRLLQLGHEVIATGKGNCRLPFESEKDFHYESMDFTDPFQVNDVFAKHKPEIVIHGGAMTKPDECEQNQYEAYKTNVEGTITLLIDSEEYQSFFIFVSTDFVFNGDKGMYSEEDIPSPVNYYGKTKLEAEEAVLEYAFDAAIVRTVLVYGKPQMGRNNLLTIVRDKLSGGEQYSVVNDQFRTPTYVEDLAEAIARIAEKRITGIYHISGKDLRTPYEMAMETAALLNLDSKLIKKVSAADFSQPAVRPPRTGFNIDKAKKMLNFEPVSFAEGLRKTFY